MPRTPWRNSTAAPLRAVTSVSASMKVGPGGEGVAEEEAGGIVVVEEVMGVVDVTVVTVEIAVETVDMTETEDMEGAEIEMKEEAEEAADVIEVTPEIAVAPDPAVTPVAKETGGPPAPGPGPRRWCSWKCWRSPGHSRVHDQTNRKSFFSVNDSVF